MNEPRPGVTRLAQYSGFASFEVDNGSRGRLVRIITTPVDPIIRTRKISAIDSGLNGRLDQRLQFRAGR